MAAKSLNLRVTAQRRVDNQGWVSCADFRAERWAVVEVDKHLDHKLVTSTSNKRHAEQLLAAELIRRSPLPRAYSLGARMPKAS